MQSEFIRGSKMSLRNRRQSNIGSCFIEPVNSLSACLQPNNLLKSNGCYISLVFVIVRVIKNKLEASK